MALKMDHLDQQRPYVVRFENESVGYGLGFHAHSDVLEYHTVECIKGRVIVFSYYWWKLLLPGDGPFSFECAQPHAVSSDEAGSVWHNAIVGTHTPDTARGMTEDAKHTRLDSRCDLPQWIKDQIAEGKTRGVAPLPEWAREDQHELTQLRQGATPVPVI
jgi:hypothetical protein